MLLSSPCLGMIAATSKAYGSKYFHSFFCVFKITIISFDTCVFLIIVVVEQKACAYGFTHCITTFAKCQGSLHLGVKYGVVYFLTHVQCHRNTIEQIEGFDQPLH